MRDELRSRLFALHEALDRRVEALCFSGGVDLVALLRIHAAALPPLAASLEAAGVAGLYPFWDGAARLAALARDLAALGAEPAPPRAVPPFGGEAAIAGAVYALEGSRLGNRVLLRRVLAAGDPSHRDALAFMTAGEPGRWQRCLGWLASRAGTLDPEAAAAGGAAVFAAYAGAAEAEAAARGAPRAA